MKETAVHYHFSSTEAKDYTSISKDEVISHMLEDFAGEMERKVKAYPEQWFNYYDFWKQ